VKASVPPDTGYRIAVTEAIFGELRFEVWEVTMPVPEAKKNRGHIRMVARRDGYGTRPVIAPNRAAAAAENRLRLELDAFIRRRHNAGRILRDGAVFPSDDVGVSMTFDPATDRIKVRVYSLRTRPKGKTGRRRDLHNILEAVLDGMQTRDTKTGLKLGLFANDNQVAHITEKRVHYAT